MAELLRILDPTVPGPLAAVPAVPRLPSLRGKLLGIRVDRAWPSFHRFAAHVADLARSRLRVRDVCTFDPGIRVGTTEEERRKVEGFVRAVDAAVVGLGT